MKPIIHISADNQNSEILSTILNEADQLYILPDTLVDGNLKNDDCSGLDEVRKQYKAELNARTGTIYTEEKGNVATIMEISSFMTNNEDAEIIYWMSGNTKDVLGYFFTLHFLRTHYERIQVINIAGLPFLNDDLQLFFPHKIAELPTIQIQKALKLKRNITPSEMEIDGEEWKQLKEENGAIRILDGNKKIKSVSENHFDTLLKSIHKPGSKINRTIQQAYSKHHLELSPEFLEYRLQQIINQSSESTSSTVDALPENQG